MLCEVTYHLVDQAAASVLDDILDHDQEGMWTQSVEIDGRQWLRGFVTLEGENLKVTTNSEARAARLRAMVEAAVPGLELVSESAKTPAEMARDRPAPASTVAEDLPGSGRIRSRATEPKTTTTRSRSR